MQAATLSLASRCLLSALAVQQYFQQFHGPYRYPYLQVSALFLRVLLGWRSTRERGEALAQNPAQVPRDVENRRLRVALAAKQHTVRKHDDTILADLGTMTKTNQLGSQMGAKRRPPS